MIKYTLIGLVIGLVVIAICHFVPVNSNETLLYKLQQYVTYNKEDWENYEHNKKLLSQKSMSDMHVPDTTIVASNTDLYPVDINRVAPEIKDRENEIIAKAHFERLKIASIRPDHQDAQIALIRLTEGRLTDIITQQKLSIKVGQCYENTNTEGNFNCVSCMILLYNREKKNSQEAPNGDNFLQNAYDFYQPSEGEQWEAKALSMRIPYDYKLQKQFESPIQ